jgi:hypothetical protein
MQNAVITINVVNVVVRGWCFLIRNVSWDGNHPGAEDLVEYGTIYKSHTYVITTHSNEEDDDTHKH